MRDYEPVIADAVRAAGYPGSDRRHALYRKLYAEVSAQLTAAGFDEAAKRRELEAFDAAVGRLELQFAAASGPATPDTPGRHTTTASPPAPPAQEGAAAPRAGNPPNRSRKPSLARKIAIGAASLVVLAAAFLGLGAFLTWQEHGTLLPGKSEKAVRTATNTAAVKVQTAPPSNSNTPVLTPQNDAERNFPGGLTKNVQTPQPLLAAVRLYALIERNSAALSQCESMALRDDWKGPPRSDVKVIKSRYSEFHRQNWNGLLNIIVRFVLRDRLSPEVTPRKIREYLDDNILDMVQDRVFQDYRKKMGWAQGNAEENLKNSVRYHGGENRKAWASECRALAARYGGKADLLPVEKQDPQAALVLKAFLQQQRATQ